MGNNSLFGWSQTKVHCFCDQVLVGHGKNEKFGEMKNKTPTLLRLDSTYPATEDLLYNEL